MTKINYIKYLNFLRIFWYIYKFQRKILWFKFKFLNFSLNKKFVYKFFIILYFWYIFFVKKISLIRFLKIFKILLSIFNVKNKQLLLQKIMSLNSRDLIWILFVFKNFIKRNLVLNFLDKGLLNIDDKFLNCKNKIILIKFYANLQFESYKKQKSKKYIFNKIQVLLNIYFLDFCFLCFSHFFYKMWKTYLNNEDLNIKNNIKNLEFKSIHLDLNSKFFILFFIKCEYFLKSRIFMKILTKKSIFKNNKEIKINFYKRIYLYYSLPFNLAISLK